VAFSTTEQSGMHVEDLSADIVVSRHGIHATNLDLQTGHSRIFMDAHLVYHGWEEMSDYCNTVEHDVVLKEGTEVNICEASYWAPMLWGMDCLLRPRGHVYGTIADMQAEQMMVDFGQESRLFVDAHVTGLPMIEKTRMDVDIHRLHTTYDDLAAVKHPEPIKMQAPDLVRDLSPIDLEASLHGGASNCLVEFGLNSTVGDLEGNANVRFDSTVNNYAYRGEVTSRGLVLSKLMPNDWVTRSGFHMTMEGRGLRLEDMELTMDGRLYDTWFKGKQIDRTVLSAEMKEGVMLGKGKGNDSWNYSAPHGAGRIMKRVDVANNYTVSDFKREMKGIYSPSISRDTIDEAPFAYRGMDEIREAINNTVEITDILRPIYNFKAGRDD
jgi:hypothetical protein